MLVFILPQITNHIRKRWSFCFIHSTCHSVPHMQCMQPSVQPYSMMRPSLKTFYICLHHATNTQPNASAFKRRFRKIDDQTKNAKHHISRNAYRFRSHIMSSFILCVPFFLSSSSSSFFFSVRDNKQDKFQCAVLYKMCDFATNARVRKLSDRDKRIARKEEQQRCVYVARHDQCFNHMKSKRAERKTFEGNSPCNGNACESTAWKQCGNQFCRL